MAGDRRATLGNIIANRDMEKVFAADEYSAVGIAGTAGIAIELVKLFQVELEHYEKIEALLSLGQGQPARLDDPANLGMAMQGLSVVPLFAGYDLDRGQGRIFSYDVTGGCYEEKDHHSVGSGSLFARGAMKKTWRPGLSVDDGISVAVEAIYDAGRRLCHRRPRRRPPHLADRGRCRPRRRALPPRRRPRGWSSRSSAAATATGGAR